MFASSRSGPHGRFSSIPSGPRPGGFYLDGGVLPIFPLEMSITVKGYSVGRKQSPVCPVFRLTEYKVQGATLNSVISDLEDDGNSRRHDSHRKYCSTYVQLSRLRLLEGLHLMRPIVMSDGEQKADPQLLEKMRRLQALQQETLRAWQTNSYDCFKCPIISFHVLHTFVLTDSCSICRNHLSEEAVKEFDPSHFYRICA